MKKTFIVLAASTFVSCWSDDNLQVLVPDDGYSYLEKYENRINSANDRRASYIDYATQMLAQDANNPDNKIPVSLLPDEYVALPGKQGFVGVVDLGMSVKWAASNENTTTSEVQQPVSFFDAFLTDLTKVPDELTIEQLVGTETLETGIIIPLDQYKKAVSDKSIVDQILAFNNKITSLGNSFASNKFLYYSYLWKTKYYFLKWQSEEPDNVWGDDWRSPTTSELQELAELCTWKYTQFNISASGLIGQSGLVGSAPNGRSIFLPGIRTKSEISTYMSRLVLK